MSERIPLSKLNKRTRDNLDVLSKHGFVWEEEAEKTPVWQPKKYGRQKRINEIIEANPNLASRHMVKTKLPRGWASSFTVKGVDPEGNPVTYYRKETASPGAGQTYIKTIHGNLRVSTFIERYSPRSPSWIPRPYKAKDTDEMSLGQLLQWDRDMQRVFGGHGLDERSAKKALDHYKPSEEVVKERDKLINLRIAEELEKEGGPLGKEIAKIRLGLPENE